MRRIEHGGASIGVPDHLKEDRATTYVAPNGGGVLSILSRPSEPAKEILRRKLETSQRETKDFVLLRTRELRVADHEAAEATLRFRGDGGAATERLLVITTDEQSYVLDFCFFGPEAEHAAAQRVFAFIASSAFL